MKIRELLSDESKWTKGVASRDSNGNEVPYSSLLATCWCLLGACCRCYDDDFLAVRDKIQSEITWMPTWNDAPERTFKEVKELVDRLDV